MLLDVTTMLASYTVRNRFYETFERPSVRSSGLVCLSLPSTAYGGFAAERYTGRRCRSIVPCSNGAAANAGAQQEKRAVSRCQLTDETEHRLVFAEAIKT